MSSDAKLTKKQKKALAFRERKGKSKATATSSSLADDAEDDAHAVPVMEDQDRAASDLGADAVVPPAEDPARDTGREEVVAGKKRKRTAGQPEERSAAILDAKIRIYYP